MIFYNFLSENIILPLSDLPTRQSVNSYLKFLMISQWLSKEQIYKLQDERLKILIKHSVETVPYYNDMFNRLGIKVVDIRSKIDLRILPVLTKATIKKEGINRFTSTSIPKNLLIKNSSSGSTGEPLFYYNTKDAYSVNISANLRGWYWMGYRLGDKYVKLSLNPRKKLIKRLQDKISRNLYLSSNPLTDENFLFILNQIEQYKPKIIRSYPDPLLFLARYKKNHPIFKHKPHAINTTGNTLFPETRKEIEEAFECEIFDSYSSEGNSTVFECPTHTCYHSAEEYGISEVIDDYGNPVIKGVGRLITTDLWNFAHPFIRYDTQDYVEVDSDPCACGRQHLKILRILGRDNDILQMENGRKFIVHDFTTFFSNDIPELNRSVEQFQIIKKDSKVVFRLVVNFRFNSLIAKFIKSYWGKEMNITVEIKIVDNIPLTESGKRRFIINE